MKGETAKVTLILGSHAHVSYGAAPGEFERVYDTALRPFISNLYKYPRIQAALHYSGVVLHWVERSHPELIMLIEDMVARKQVEMLGGGFYEPALSIIPAQDKIGQIELLTTYLRRQFGKRPQGCWIPAFAWEHSLVNPLAACGMGFTFLSERQFALAGGSADSPCICEDQGKFITVFPVLHSLEAALADKSAAALLRSLLDDFNRRHPDKKELVVSIFPAQVSADPGEAMDCAWNRFFEELSLCEPFVETVIPGKLARSLQGLPKRYFPDSLYAAEYTPPRRFVIEHPEASGIYAKMVFTNVLINQLRGDKSRKLSAHEELWKAQGNDLFYRGGRRGLHNHALRNAAYSALLGAERVTREKTAFSPSLVPFDFNMDGEGEWLFQDARINCYVQSTGGGIFELDYLPKVWNYLDSCAGRTAFADRLLPSELKLEKLTCGAATGARMCGAEIYQMGDLDRVRRKLALVLREAPPESDAPAGAAVKPFAGIAIEKTYMLKKDAIVVGYSLVNRGTKKEAFQFAPEIDLALPGEGDAFVRFFICKTSQADAALTHLIFRGGDGLKIHDIKNEVQITLSANRSFDGKIAPVYIPDSESGENLYQAYCIMPVFPLSLLPGGKIDIELTLKFSH